jgi:hypothetical protein
MDVLRRFGRDRAALLAGLLVPAAVAAGLTPWRTAVPNTDGALILVVVVVAVAVAAAGNRAAGLLASASAALWFDFFLTVPYEHFAITRRTDLETTLLLLAVGVAVTELALRSRRHQARSDTEAAYVTALHTTAELLAGDQPGTAVAEQVTIYLTALLGLRACRYEDGVALGRPPSLQPDGHIAWNNGRWDIDRHGLPDCEIELRVRADGHVLGRFMLAAQPATAPSREARLVAVALADQLGAKLALQRGIVSTKR